MMHVPPSRTAQKVQKTGTGDWYRYLVFAYPIRGIVPVTWHCQNLVLPQPYKYLMFGETKIVPPERLSLLRCFGATRDNNDVVKSV